MTSEIRSIQVGNGTVELVINYALYVAGRPATHEEPAGPRRGSTFFLILYRFPHDTQYRSSRIIRGSLPKSSSTMTILNLEGITDKPRAER